MFDPNLLIPAYGADIDRKSKLYARGRKETVEALKTGNSDRLANGIKIYQDAFDSGVVEAGVNILAVSACASINNVLVANEYGYKIKTNVFQQPIQVYTELVNNAKHPSGAYYLGFCTIYELYKMSQSRDSDVWSAWTLMYGLADRGNVYASNFLNFCLAYHFELLPPQIREEQPIILPFQAPPLDEWGATIYQIWD